ncbi:MAG: outer membrane protein assembly factor BamE [Pseudomonadota bacterium]
MQNQTPLIDHDVCDQGKTSSKLGKNRLAIVLAVPLLALGVSACNTTETFNLGYVQDERTIALVETGASRDQVLLALGTPSQITSGTGDGGDTFYYISQTKTRALAYQRARIVNQRVLAIYFDGEDQVSRKANYGLEDGKVFDYISRTTPTGGRDLSFIGQLLGSFGRIAR